MKYLIFADGEIEEVIEGTEEKAKEEYSKLADENKETYLFKKLELVECKTLNSSEFEDARYEETIKEKKELSSNMEIKAKDD